MLWPCIKSIDEYLKTWFGFFKDFEINPYAAGGQFLGHYNLQNNYLEI